jgi:hypothetical protein
MISLLLQAINLLTLKVEYGPHRVRCQENQTSTKVVGQEHAKQWALI